MELIKIRLEACSLSSEFNENLATNDPNAKLPRPILQTAVGRATSKPKTDGQRGFLWNMEIGERLCCVIDQPLPSNGQVPHEVDVSPYTACEVPLEVSLVDCTATVAPAVRIYTALHTLARVRSDESVLIACPNDLNFTFLAIQTCNRLGLAAYALVLDDAAKAFLKEEAKFTNAVSLENLDASSLASVCDQLSHGLGFDCILDFRNTVLEPTGIFPVSLSILIRFLAAFGRVVHDRQDPISASDVSVLRMKSANLHFLFDRVWHLSPLHVGRYNHMVLDVVTQLKEGGLKPIIGLQIDSAKVEEAMARHDDKVGSTVLLF